MSTLSHGYCRDTFKPSIQSTVGHLSPVEQTSPVQNPQISASRPIAHQWLGYWVKLFTDSKSPTERNILPPPTTNHWLLHLCPYPSIITPIFIKGGCGQSVNPILNLHPSRISGIYLLFLLTLLFPLLSLQLPILQHLLSKHNILSIESIIPNPFPILQGSPRRCRQSELCKIQIEDSSRGMLRLLCCKNR